MEKNNKRVALYGISHVSNFGCEAIIRSTFAMLRECLPDCSIVYASRNARADKVILNDLDLEIQQVSRKPDIFSRIFNKVCKILHVRFRISYDRYRRFLRNIDMIVSVGGDIYTVEKNDWIKGYKCNNEMVTVCEYAKKIGCKVVLYGGSIGPFPKNDGNEEYFRRHLAKLDLLICRESGTIRYLKELGITNSVVFSPDPAFYLRPNKTESIDTIRNGIAVNLSSRLLIPGQNEEAQIQCLSNILVQMSHQLMEKIYLVPHVYSNSKSDDDFYFMSKVLARIPEADKENIEIYALRGGFFDVKKFLSTKKMVIAARMHCAINAMSEGIPTILISYSQKATGMSEFIYGTKHWAINAEELENGLLPLSEEMIHKLTAIEDIIAQKMTEIREKNPRGDLQKKIAELLI